MVFRLLIIFCLISSLFFSCNTEKKEPVASDIITTKKDYYKEPHRNQFHFAPEANWMNDPNGMVYHDGEYHLYYQYYPDSTVWGPMHWAHAVSKDLVHWEHLPIAIYPDSLGFIFSGSAVVDKNNTAGFGKDAIVAIYTYHDMEAEQSKTSNTYQYQAIAYSTDNGRTFTKYEGNPVIPNPGIKDFRDPKVIWHDNSDQWVMVFAAKDHVRFYGSKNLKDWTHLSNWGYEYGVHTLWECPDLFPLKVKNSTETKWVLLQSLNPGAPNGGSGTQYFIGDFNGKEFIIDTSFAAEVPKGKGIWLDYGTDNYAGVTWSNAPVDNETALFIGWMSNWQYAQIVPTEKWRSAMTIARTLHLYKESEGYRLRSNPVDAMDKIMNTKFQISNEDFKKGKMTYDGQLDDGFVIDLDVELNASKKSVVRFSNKQGEYIDVGFDALEKNYFIDRRHSGKVDFEKGFAGLHRSPQINNNGKIQMKIFVDQASVELFADGGKTAMTDIFFSNAPLTQISFIHDGAVLNKGSLHSIKSIWR